MYYRRYAGMQLEGNLTIAGLFVSDFIHASSPFSPLPRQFCPTRTPIVRLLAELPKPCCLQWPMLCCSFLLFSEKCLGLNHGRQCDAVSRPGRDWCCRRSTNLHFPSCHTESALRLPRHNQRRSRSYNFDNASLAIKNRSWSLQWHQASATLLAWTTSKRRGTTAARNVYACQPQPTRHKARKDTGPPSGIQRQSRSYPPRSNTAAQITELRRLHRGMDMCPAPGDGRCPGRTG